jgi:hypothetical protein
MRTTRGAVGRSRTRLLTGLTLERREIRTFSAVGLESKSLPSVTGGVGMKAACIALIAVLCLSVVPASAQYYIAAGPQLNGLVGSGEGGNKFGGLSKGPGALLEFGLQVPKAVLGLAIQAEWYKSTNTVGSHDAKATFLVPFQLEFRYNMNKGSNMRPFLGLGMGWARMSFEGSDGADNQLLILVSAGVQFRLAKGKMIVQPALKPYVVTSNSLEQSTGLQLSLLIGRAW